jgi:hypothetical protein
MWSKPVNVGYPINTTDDNFFFCPVRDGKIAYISRFDPNGAGRFDITRMNIFSNDNPRKYMVHGIVKIPQNMSQQPFILALYDKTKKDTVFKKIFTGNEIAFEAIPGQYEVHISSDGLEHKSMPFNIHYGSKDLSPDIHIDLTQKKAKLEIAKEEPPKALVANTQNTSNQSLPDVSMDETKINAAAKNQESNIDTSTIAATDSILNFTQIADTAATKPPNTGIKPEENIPSKLYTLLHSPSMIASVLAIIALLFIIVILMKKRNKSNQ